MQTSSAASRVQASVEELFKGKITAGDAYVKFQLTSDITALLSMDRVEESSILEAEQITPLPSMPESVIGITSSRDLVFCVFDLAQLLTLSSSFINHRQYQIIVLKTNDVTPIYLGFAVNSLQGIIRFPSSKILPLPKTFTADFTPFISGLVEVNENNLPVLNLESIFKTIRESF